MNVARIAGEVEWYYKKKTSAHTIDLVVKFIPIWARDESFRICLNEEDEFKSICLQKQVEINKVNGKCQKFEKECVSIAST